MAEQIEKIDGDNIRITVTHVRIVSKEELLEEERMLSQELDVINKNAEKLQAKLSILRAKTNKMEEGN